MLKITRLADYSISVISSFSGDKNEILSSQDIISKTKLQKATVNKLLSKLVKKDFLLALRGVNGGYKLKKDLADISIKELIEAIEGPVALTDCLDKNTNNCNLFDICNTKNTWSVVNTAIKETLQGIKIKDVKNNAVNYKL